MQHFADRLVNRIAELQNPTVVGLDPRLEQIPEFIKEKAVEEYGQNLEAAATALIIFNVGIIDAIADLVPAVKIQIAFYEQFGHAGIFAYEQTVQYAQDAGLIVIGDVKRNDISSTAAAYAMGHLGNVDVFGQATETLKTDAITVTPYLGSDGITPFTDVCKVNGSGLFVLVRTSNPSSDEIQSQPIGDQLLDEHVAHLVEGWGRDLIGESGFSSVGAVVGATYPEEARSLRNLMPHQIFLVPGYGAQGGGAKDVEPCFYENGTGALVNSSRGIIFAYQQKKMPETEFQMATRTAVEEMKADLSQLFQK